MNICAVGETEQLAIFHILAGILHLGNVDFVEEGNNAIIADADGKFT